MIAKQLKTTEKITCTRPSVRCACCTMSLRVHRVSIAFRFEKGKRPASGSRKFRAQLARKNCKISEKFRRAPHKSCVNPASVVAQNLRILLQLHSKSMCVRMRDKARVPSVEITQNLRKNRTKNLQNFRKFSTPAAPGCAHKNFVKFG